MSKKHIFLYFCTLNIAFGLNMDEILTSIEKNSALKKSLQYKKQSLESLSKSERSGDPAVISGISTRANPTYIKSGMEYEIGISKMLKLPNSLDESISRLSNEAMLLEDETKVIELENRAKNLYHQSCVDTKSLNSFREEYSEFRSLYRKKQRAYQLGDISKLELMQFEMQNSEMQRSLDEKIANEQTSRDFVLNMAYIDNKTKLSCNDLYDFKSKVDLGEVFAITNNASAKRIQSNNQLISKYSQPIDAVEFLASYSSELEQEKYRLGIAVPLNFTSRKNEYKKLSAMSQNSELELRKEHDIKELSSGLERFYYDLKIEHLKINNIEKNINYYKTKLLPLAKKSFEYGQSSAMEYLMAKEKLYALQNELYATQKRYYDARFGLYSVAQVRGKR